MPEQISRKQAEAAFDAIKAQFAAYLEPLVIDGKDYGPTYEPPTLVHDVSGDYGYRPGGWVVMWEEGPEDWPFIIGGGHTEEEAVLIAQANVEFGTSAKVADRPAAKIPAGVFAEPINHYSIGLYPS